MTTNSMAVLTPEASPSANVGVFDVSEVVSFVPVLKPDDGLPVKLACMSSDAPAKPVERSEGIVAASCVNADGIKSVARAKRGYFREYIVDGDVVKAEMERLKLAVE